MEKLSILLVEDHTELRELLLSVIINLHIFEVQSAKCLEDALTIIKEKEIFSIVILDLNLCNSFEDGIFLAEKTKERNCSSIIVISTGYYDNLFDSRLINLPIDDFIKKPFSIEFFSEKLLMWATLYKHRAINREYLNSRMKKYEGWFDTLQLIESKLKILLEGRDFNNGGT